MFEGLFQPMHLLFFLLIGLVFFGPGRLPEPGAGLGKGIREFRKAMADGATAAGETKETPKESPK